MTSKDEREGTRRLALLCLEEKQFSDEELQKIVQAEPDLGNFFRDMARFADHGAARTLRGRSRRKELEGLPTEELERRMKEILRDRAHYLDSHHEDDIDDSFFEAPPSDSDQYLIHEILKERKEALAGV